MHCMNADLSGQAITVAVAVKQASVAHAPTDLASCRHAAVTALPAFIQHHPLHHVPRPHSTAAY